MANNSSKQKTVRWVVAAPEWVLDMDCDGPNVEVVPAKAYERLQAELEKLQRSQTETRAPHTPEQDYQHWLSYTNRAEAMDLRAAFFAGADVPPDCDGATPMRASMAEVVLPNTAEPTASPVHPGSAPETPCESKVEMALRGLYWDQVDYLTLNKLGGLDNHWMKAAREALGIKRDTPIPGNHELRHDSPEIQFSDVFDELDKGHPVNTRDAINALWWKVRNQRREIARLHQKGEVKASAPTCKKHGVELAFEGDECWECKKERQL